MDDHLEELKSERASLALAAEQGDEAAAARLDEIENQLERESKLRERTTLAEAERARLAEEAAQTEADEERMRNELELRQLCQAQLESARGLDEDLSEIGAGVVWYACEFLDRSARISDLVRLLGGPAHSDRAGRLLEHRLRDVFAHVFSAAGMRSPFDLPPPAARGVELLEAAQRQYAPYIGGEGDAA